MTKLIIGFLIISTYPFEFAIAQTTKVTFILFNPCDSTYTYDLSGHFLYRDGQELQPSDTLGTIKLPSVGKYSLKINFPDYYSEYDTIVQIKHSGQNYDTLRQATIVACSGGMHRPSCGYWCCESLCNGYNVDYYPNRNKRVEGTFKNGQPIGQLVFYYSNGDKKAIRTYDSIGKGIMRKEQTFRKQNKIK